MPPHGYLVEAEDHYDPLSKGNTASTASSSGTISNKPSFVREGFEKNVEL